MPQVMRISMKQSKTDLKPKEKKRKLKSFLQRITKNVLFYVLDWKKNNTTNVPCSISQHFNVTISCL